MESGYTREEVKASLHLREWLTLAFFLAFFASILFFSFLESREKEFLMHSPLDEMTVFIEGAVEKPGIYRVKKGTTISELLKRAEVKNCANLAKIDLNKGIHDGERLKIKALKMINIQILHPDGSLEEREIPRGYRIEDFERAHPSYKVQWNNKRRKILRDGDVILLKS